VTDKGYNLIETEGVPIKAWTKGAKLFDEDGGVTQEYQRPQDRPAALCNGMIAPLIPLGSRGALWYQGESNAGRASEYRELSELMITDWRERWGLGSFPFLFVKLAAWQPGGDNWPLLQEAQLQTLDVPNTAMAVAIDIGDRGDIHPRNKQEVGKRLALAARAIAYDEDIVFSGPIFRGMQIDGDKVELTFNHIGGGLQAQDDALKGFEVAGLNGEYAAAEATIEDNRVVLQSDQVAEPTAVRYNWAAYPDGNLYNAEGLPASPFRTSE
jgi:sialate O-acetylesterase